MLSNLTKFHQFLLALLILLGALFFQQRVILNGDVYEYTVMSVALASHLSPDIQSEDLRKVQHLLPQYAPYFKTTEEGIRAGKQQPNGGFYRALDDNTYSIHFFSYSALAAIPLFVFEKIGIDPFKSFWFVNLVFIFVLGVSLYRFFASARKAFLGLVLFMLSGGVNYAKWSSPECMSSAAVLSAMLLFVTDAPLAGGLLIGLAATQNPPIVCLLMFGPLLFWSTSYQSQLSFKDNLRLALHRRMLIGIGAGFALFLIPVGFNLWMFGVPNIIAKIAASPALISLGRLQSFYFDWNQGLIIGIPGLWIGSAVLLWRSRGLAGNKWKLPAVALICITCALALAIPALATTNWNSAAHGMMRYASWGGAPFLFLFLFLLRQQTRLPFILLLCVGLLQLRCTIDARHYSELGLSPMGKFMLENAPAWYNPDPEIFIERTGLPDGAPLDVGKLYAYEVNGERKKLMFHESSTSIDRELCGPGKLISPDTQFGKANFGWFYINGAVQCDKADELSLADFQKNASQFSTGWSYFEDNGTVAQGEWNGIWSDGPSSVMDIAVSPARPVHGVRILVHYFKNNERTRVVINGEDIGWVDLRSKDVLRLKMHAGQAISNLKIELTHEAPHDPRKDPDFPTTRRLAVFVHGIRLS
ncbi:hypothetical protein [Undibacterium terreum]|uniref:Uncharacterized protein n=1 Tax=Undibacterium terreum TaxID=1224302 RepID=A0A916XD11_9BURK|nr:hypothetical protein [Undibacterium terreum]GGC62796.1 hypothetical protein GCM10011396_07220 [Undibacterium terreum]